MLRRLRRVLLQLLLIVVATIAGGGLWLRWRIRASLPLLDGVVRVSGLAAPVSVLRDARGVPHIRAQSLADALFTQGYITAQDRLWQMDLNRRNAEGTLSEVFGPLTVQLDEESRRMDLPQVAERGLADLTPQERRLLDAYTRGVNTFIEGHRGRLAPEFLVLRYQPQTWRPIDSVAVALNLAVALSQTWESDLRKEHVLAKLGSELAADVFPDHSPLDVPVAEVPDSSAAKPTATHSALDMLGDGAFADALLPAAWEPPSGLGSNDWVLSGAHTRSGKPLLANDPHLAHSVPSVWYMLQLKAPGLDVAGVSLPGLPMVIIGHNQHIAWGMTNTHPDVQDLYIETFNPNDPNQYLHNGQWEQADLRDEIIKVRGRQDRHLSIKSTRHGPIISHDGNRALALQWTLLGAHGVRLPFLQIDQAGNWQEFTAALHDFSIPMQNCVYADDQGNIGFYAAGLVPIRKKGDGSVPVPGDTDDYDWKGYIPFAALPHAYNPPGGIIATANGRIVPDNYPYFITSMWEPPYRTARIFALLRQRNDFTPPDMLRVQTDILTLEDQWLAQKLAAAAEKQPPSTADARFAMGTLKGWDGEARADSAATLVLETTRPVLLKRILQPRLGDTIKEYRWPMSTTFLQNVIDQNLTRWLPPGDADFNVTLMKSLEEGVRQIPALVHSQDHAAWTWGDTIPLTFHHPLSLGTPFLGRWLNVGPFPQAGTGATIKQTTTRLGPSMRMVVDFSDLDQSMQNITLGESGHFLSPYYRDQFTAWYEGKSFPMLFSDAAVDKGAAHKLTLAPGP